MTTRIAACTCGNVEFEVAGAPIVTLICCCDDCQEGARRIEALPGALPVLDAYGGTAVILMRKDRVVCTKGETLLKGFKLKDKSITNRVVATCCNAPMVVSFDRGPHWVSIFRDRLGDFTPPVEMRIQTRFASTEPDGHVPGHSRFPPGLIVRIALARIAMLFSR